MIIWDVFFCNPWKTIVAKGHEQCKEGLDTLEQNSEERKQSYMSRFLTPKQYNTTAMEQS
jgi:hypothetical protein